MDAVELERAVLKALYEVAPEVEETGIDPELPLRDQVDLDSIDYLRFLTALDVQLGIAVPEADYARVETLAGLVQYLAQELERRSAESPRGESPCAGSRGPAPDPREH